MIYLIGVMWSAYRFGPRASFLTSILSVVSFDFFFVPPYLSFAVSDTQYVLTFCIMLGTGFFISTMAGHLRQQTETLSTRAERMRALYKLSHGLSAIPEPRQMLGAAAKQLEEFYKEPILILTTDSEGKLDISAGDPTPFGWNENEMSVASWVFDKGQMAGAGSDTLSGSSGLYLPLKGLRRIAGVVGIRPKDPKLLMDPEQLQLLETFAAEIGGALDSTRMSEAIGRAETELELHAIKNSQPEAPIHIGDFLDEKKILILASGLSKDQILSASCWLRLKLPNPAKALQAILERENAGATFIGNGLSIPHARIPGSLSSLQLALGISSEGPINLWFVFLSPAEDPKLHLIFLACIATLFREVTRVEELKIIKTPAEALNYIRQSEMPLSKTTV